MAKLSTATKSFIALLVLAFGTSFIALALNRQLGQNLAEDASNNFRLQKQIYKTAQRGNGLDVAKWLSYTDSAYGLSFKYPPAWRVQAFDRAGGMRIIVLEPASDPAVHIRIYASKDGYFATDGLDKKTASIAGRKGFTVDNLLAGVKSKTDYFTFDLGYGLNYQPQFKEMLKTVAINE